MSRVVPRFRATALSLIAVGLTTVLCSRVAPVNATTAAMAYLLVILFIGTVATLSEGIIASFGAMLLFNYFFLPPDR